MKAQILNDKNKTVKNIVAGTLAGISGTVVGHPLDTIKLRLQTKSGAYFGIINCAKSIIAEDGIAGLFRGMASPLISLTLLNSLSFGIYGNFREIITRYFEDYKIGAQFLLPYLAGFCVGLTSCVISTPFEFVKVRLQHPSGRIYDGCLDLTCKLMKQHGPLIFYTGNTINCIRESIYCTLYFGTYETMKNIYYKTLKKYFHIDSIHLSIVVAGGCAGSLGLISSYPLDVIKNLKQTQEISEKWSITTRNSSWSLIKKRYKSYGIGGFYQGIRLSVIRSFFVSGTRFSGYELALRIWDSLRIGLQ